MNTQLILVIVLSAGAAFFLGLRFYKMISGKNKSGSCSDCSVDDSKKSLAGK